MSPVYTKLRNNGTKIYFIAALLYLSSVGAGVL